jgi:hypothetical protein
MVARESHLAREMLPTGQKMELSMYWLNSFAM